MLAANKLILSTEEVITATLKAATEVILTSNNLMSAPKKTDLGHYKSDLDH